MRPHLEDEGGLDGQRLLVAQVFQQLLHLCGAAEGLEGGVQIVQSCTTAATSTSAKLSQGLQGQIYYTYLYAQAHI